MCLEKTKRLRSTDFAGRRVLVMGLGSFGGGAGVTRFLVEKGAKVTVTDQRGANDLAEGMSQLDGLDITFRLNGHQENDFTAEQNDLIVVNPAVKKNSPYLKIAREQNVPRTSEMNIFFQLCPATIVGVTGSNGKSTTTAMIGAVLQAGAEGRAEHKYRQVWVGGNIGQENLLVQIEHIEPDDVVVLELSSFQLYDLQEIRVSPPVAVLTNIGPNHLDWHGSMQAYVQAKQNILRYQKKTDAALLNQRDKELAGWEKLTPGEVRWYPKKNEEPIKLQVPGRHNQVNASAAAAVGELFGIEPSAAQEALFEFKGLEHRLELVRELKGVRYYNDSLATTPESVMVAMDAFHEPLVLILGGYDKKISLVHLAEKVVKTTAVQAVILLGQVREKLAQEIEQCKTRANSSFPMDVKVDSLAEAVILAQRRARPGMAVLLSPGCASYDMFQNFRQRGEQFRQLVHELE
ncbi:MAG: hypothetical protein AMJ79_04125 [Phycisphaerae bacterium SM23_30]|nr:MAG: hypothetical protein AMJ79_04125 [Phycisphaerae bacterium SM23_30]